MLPGALENKGEIKLLGGIKVEGGDLYDPPELGKGSRGGSMRWSARERGNEIRESNLKGWRER